MTVAILSNYAVNNIDIFFFLWSRHTNSFDSVHKSVKRLIKHFFSSSYVIFPRLMCREKNATYILQ